jgi:hypothetical protein
MLQGQKDLNTVTRRILSELAQVVNAQQGMFYILEQDEEQQNKKLKLILCLCLQRRTEHLERICIG